MGAIWLGTLPQVLRDAGLTVDTYPGWETRSRSSGGYDGIYGIQVHHTASSGANPANEMAYMWKNAAAQPIGAIYLATDGRVTVGAAGATNTSGKGGPLATSRGTIPLDSANRYVIAIEAANPGDGTPWPKAQTDAYVTMVAALVNAYMDGTVNLPGDVQSHFEWAPGRKNDPAGQSPYATGRNMWNMTKFRLDVSTTLKPPPPPPPSNGATVTTTSEWQQARIGGDDGFVFQGSQLVKVPQAVGKKAVTVNLHVVTPNHDGFVQAFLGARPNTSAVNYKAHVVSDGTITVPVDENGWFALHSSGYVKVLVDLVGVHS